MCKSVVQRWACRGEAGVNTGYGFGGPQAPVGCSFARSGCTDGCASGCARRACKGRVGRGEGVDVSKGYTVGVQTGG